MGPDLGRRDADRGKDELAMKRRINSRQGTDGFTLIEIVAALAILGVALVVLLQTHFASLNLFIDVEDQAMMDVFVTQAVGIAEFEVLAGTESGAGDFGELYEGYAYSFSADLRDPEVAPGLFDVTVQITGPEDSHSVTFLLYDGLQIDLE